MTARLVWLGEDEPEPATNTAPVDSWTALHVVSGAALGALGVPLGWTMAIGAAYEIGEHFHESPRGSALFGSKRPESLANVVVDTVAMAAGWGLVAVLAGR